MSYGDERISDWQTVKQVLSTRKFAILGDRTMAENYTAQAAKWAKGQGQPDLPYGPRSAGFWPRDWKPGDAIRPPRPPRDEAAELELHLTRVGVPLRLAAVLKSGLQETTAVERVKSWFASDRSLLLLYGDTGVGKSCAAASLFLLTKKASWVDGMPEWDSIGAFVDAQDIGQNLFTDEGKELIGYLEATNVLVLDELGVETMSGPWASTLDNLVNKRFGNPKLRTILATNVSARRLKPGEDGYDEKHPESAFERRYGARIARRIRESGDVFAVRKA